MARISLVAVVLAVCCACVSASGQAQRAYGRQRAAAVATRKPQAVHHKVARGVTKAGATVPGLTAPPTSIAPPVVNPPPTTAKPAPTPAPAPVTTTVKPIVTSAGPVAAPTTAAAAGCQCTLQAGSPCPIAGSPPTPSELLIANPCPQCCAGGVSAYCTDPLAMGNNVCNVS